MRNIHVIIAFGLPIAALTTYGITTNNVSADDGDTAQDEYNNDLFPRALKYLVPPPVPVYLVTPNVILKTNTSPMGR